MRRNEVTGLYAHDVEGDGIKVTVPVSADLARKLMADPDALRAFEESVLEEYLREREREALDGDPPDAA